MRYSDYFNQKTDKSIYKPGHSETDLSDVKTFISKNKDIKTISSILNRIDDSVIEIYLRDKKIKKIMGKIENGKIK